ncbi:Glycosyl transferase family 2 [Botrimarina colliarenosi]|uniref:Glycosyl transferase family 2 n=1 Tax=Botrimarina colliarenosi TaxID=2528001 RepID=A0A5C6AE68_9BACT|nr:glycosyltransferase family 2 protein [Botrimarina colliarenosi]TWT97608.1 Glycosyl transferase family 2 [Botrimarina colliarenosi]
MTTASIDTGMKLGVVAIGRNEGERLRRCLESLRSLNAPVVYVDSDSTDGSQEMAGSSGVTVLTLDPARPFNAARARGEGFERLLAVAPETDYVFFIDGDCETAPGWCGQAVATLEKDPRLAAVCGRRRERFPQASAFNLLCDYEWDTAVGECGSVGGDSVWRVSAYRDAGGFDPTVAAGEEPELCHRARAAGWSLRRIDAEMTIHDADLHHFRPWLRRQLRTGYNGADVESRFGIRVFDRLLRGAVFWAVGYPVGAVAAVALAAFAGGISAAVAVATTALLGIVLQTGRIASGITGRPWRDRCRLAGLMMIAKPPIAAGWLWWAIDQLRGKRPRLIEYKPAVRPTASQEEPPCYAPR